MSAAVFPTLPGLTYDIVRTPIWGNTTEQFVSGKELRINNGWTYPRYQWDLTFSVLRSDAVLHEFQTLIGFYNARNGSYDSFQYHDADDNSITGQQFGIGFPGQHDYQLVRNFGTFIEPVFAPNVVSAVYINSVLQDPATYSVNDWGTSKPGIITFASVPSTGLALTADFTYYFPVRFVDDKLPFNNFMKQLYNCQKLSLISIK